MAVNHVEPELPVKRDGGTFVSSGLKTFRTADEAFEVAHEFEQLAHSRTLRNPHTALSRAHEVLDIAVQMDAQNMTA